MLRRQGYKAQKVALGVTLYATLYFALAWLTAPAPLRTFVSEEFKMRNRYVLVYLWSEKGPTGSFCDRRCEWCIITSDRDFMPRSEYDAVLVEEDVSNEAHAVYRRSPDKLYTLNTSSQCISAKFQDCDARTTSVYSRRSFDLCGLCEHVRRERKPRPFVII